MILPLIGLGLTALGMFQSQRNARDMQSAQNRALAAARTTLGGFSGGYNVGGLGPTATMDPQGAGFRLSYDADSQRIAQGAGQYGSQWMEGLGLNPTDTQLGLAGPYGLDAVFNRNQGVTNQNFADMLALQSGGFQRPLQNTAFMGAANQLRDASMGGEDARLRTLDLLRSQAAPFESRALDDLQNRQFSMGQLGSSGGALQTEAFARGLGQADLERQLQASQEGRNFTNNALGLAQGMTGIGSGLRSQESQMLNDVFGRFSTMQGMNADLSAARFERSMYAPQQLRQLQFGNINSALGLRSGLQDQALQMFQAGLAGSQAGANARIGSASNMANIVGSPNFGMGGMMQAGALGQIGSVLMGGRTAGSVLGDVGGALSGLFGNHQFDTSTPGGFAGSGINPYTALPVG